MDLPMVLTDPDIASPVGGWNPIPPNVNLSTISFWCELLAPLTFFMSHPCTTVRAGDDGRSIALRSIRVGFTSGITEKSDPTGWTVVEVVLVRSANIYAPSGHFPVYINKSELYAIGCDAAVCVQKYEPWIIEVSNTSTVPPSVLRVVGRGDSSASLPPSGTIRGAPLTNVRYLNATERLPEPFRKGHENSVNQMMNNNGRDPHHYFPYPAVCTPCTSAHNVSSNFG